MENASACVLVRIVGLLETSSVYWASIVWADGFGKTRLGMLLEGIGPGADKEAVSPNSGMGFVRVL